MGIDTNVHITAGYHRCRIIHRSYTASGSNHNKPIYQKETLRCGGSSGITWGFQFQMAKK